MPHVLDHPGLYPGHGTKNKLDKQFFYLHPFLEIRRKVMYEFDENASVEQTELELEHLGFQPVFLTTKSPSSPNNSMNCYL